MQSDSPGHISVHDGVGDGEVDLVTAADAHHYVLPIIGRARGKHDLFGAAGRGVADGKRRIVRDDPRSLLAGDQRAERR